ncbi:SET domain-containing protein [Lophiostoma macrostomum CBS 122681]|uniref:SET domain-containing protein n=1 Tax=Lophiostoma macrostomum CBS 122681 TaxID=1314788 RepID=A0A6A6TB98_9PLEO|nr:SET domain-containing protein [Lophiostoma macrostomum CBS 122681]
MWRIRTSTSKGLGLFATRRIPRGTRILSEQPLLSLQANQQPISILKNARALDDARRKEVLVLSGFTGRGVAWWGRWGAVLWWVVKNGWEGRGRSMKTDIGVRGMGWWKRVRMEKQILDIWRSNSFHIPLSTPLSSPSSTPSTPCSSSPSFTHALFPTIARCNHSCIPNAQANWHPALSAFNVHALRDIAAHEEICLSYLEERGEGRDARRRVLSEGYGFECACEACGWDAEGEAGEEDDGGMGHGDRDGCEGGEEEAGEGAGEGRAKRNAKAKTWESERLAMQTRLAAHQASISTPQPTSHSAAYTYSSDGTVDTIPDTPQAPARNAKDESAVQEHSPSLKLELELTRAFAHMLLAQGVRGREVASMLYRGARNNADIQEALDMERDCLGEDHGSFVERRRGVERGRLGFGIGKEG